MNLSQLHKQTFVVQSRTSECAHLVELLAAFIKSNDIPDKINNDLRLVLEEAFVNIVDYAHPKDKDHSITVEFNNNADSISITFIDSGIAFNPLTDCGANIETDDHCEGGMGIHIIKSLIDEQKYDRIKQHNVFTVTKHYTK